MTRPALTLAQIEDRFREAMRAAGAPIDDPLDLSGKLRRFHVAGDKRGAKNGWYQAHADGNPTVVFGIWGRLDSTTHSLFSDTDATPEERAEQARRVEAARRQREADERKRHDAAARKAAALWERATPAPDSHPYLVRKGTGPHDLRVATWHKRQMHETGEWEERRYDDVLLVPLRNKNGALRNLQAIAPGKDFPGGRDKDFLAGGEKSGCFYLLGEPNDGHPLLVCEGFATGSSLREATGYAVAIAFDCGNLLPVAQVLRVKWPDAPLLIAGDNDAQTAGNPGATKAREAAEATGARWCVPSFAGLADAGKATDFNDLQALAGAAEVARHIAAALEVAPCPTPTAPTSPAAAPPAQVATPQRFVMNPPGFAKGVYLIERDRDGNPKAPQWICSPLLVPTRTRAPDGTGWGYLCVFDDPDGMEHKLIVPAEKLRGDGLEALGLLLDHGLRVSPAGKRLVVEYVQTAAPKLRARITRRTGWQDAPGGGRVFVLPAGAIGEAGEEWIFDGTAEHIRAAGTLAEWRNHIAKPCSGNSRLVFSVCIGFAAPLMRFASIEPAGGFHWRGNSSLGKSLLLELVQSLIGPPDRVERWNTTGAGLEALAAARCDSPLPLDELRMIDPRLAATAVYQLCSGSEKARGRAEGGLRARTNWRGLILSSGEISLGQHVQEAGGKNHAGQDVRLVDLIADAGAGFGVFEQLHDAPSSKVLHDRLSRAVRKYHGTAFTRWVEAIAKTDALELGDFVRGVTARFESEFLSETASGQARRVATRFALVAAAGELATRHDLTGWEQGESIKAAGRLFRDWLHARGGEGRSEDRDMLRQVRLFFEAHGEGRFTDMGRAGDDHAPKTLHRAGYRRVSPDSEHKPVAEQRTEFLVLPEVFKHEICRGLDCAAVVKLMQERGFISNKGEAQRPGQIREQIPGVGRIRVYHVLASFMESDLD